MISIFQSTTIFRQFSAAFGVISLLLSTACTHDPIAAPPRADLEAITEAKPAPSAAILTDPTASAEYNADVEAWGERLHSAGLRVCRYFERMGADVECDQ